MNVAAMATAPTRVDRRLFITLPIALVGVQIVVGGADLLLAAALDAVGPASGSVTTFGVITAVASFVALLVYPLAGHASDRTAVRMGRRSAWVVAGSLGSAAGLIVMSQARSSAELGVGFVVVVAFVPVMVVPLYASIPDRIAVPRRGSIGALVGAATIAGGIAGNVLAAGFATRIAAGTLVFAAVLVLGAAAFALFGGESRTIAPDDRLPDGGGQSPEYGPGRSGTVGHSADFVWFTIGRFALFLAYAIVAALAYYVVRDYLGSTNPAAAVATFAVVTGSATLLAALATGPWSDRIGRRKPFVVVAAGLLGAGVLVPAVAPTMTAFLVAAAIIGIGFGIYLAVGTALGTQVLPDPSAAGRDIGLIGLANAGAAAVAPFLGSQAASTFGYPAMFALAAASAMAAMGALLRIRSVR
jgi:MFS family permease